MIGEYVRLILVLSFMLATAPGVAAEIDFAHAVVPVLKQHCGKCHTGDQKKGGLSLNTRETTLIGGESGKVVVSGKSVESELVQRLTSDDPDVRMPPEGPRVPVAGFFIEGVDRCGATVGTGLHVWTASV